MKFFVAEPRLRRPALSNNGKHFAGVDWLAFVGEDALDGAALGRADFVLHLHGFDNEKTLAGLDVLSSLGEQTHDFTWHGCNDLLAAFGFDTTVAASAPCAWINDFGDEFARSSVKLEFAVQGRRHSDFEGLAVK